MMIVKEKEDDVRDGIVLVACEWREVVTLIVGTASTCLLTVPATHRNHHSHPHYISGYPTHQHTRQS